MKMKLVNTPQNYFDNRQGLEELQLEISQLKKRLEQEELLHKSLYIHLGKNFDKFLGEAYAPLVSGGITLLLLWLILHWMYKKKIFIRI